QRLAQQTRNAENQLLQAEKSRVLDWFYQSREWPETQFTHAWENVMLAQHHDCWIVPYNNLNGHTWYENVKLWTDKAMAESFDLMGNEYEATNDSVFTVRNLLPYDRKGIVISEKIYVAADTNRHLVNERDTPLPILSVPQADGETYRLAAL